MPACTKRFGEGRGEGGVKKIIETVNGSEPQTILLL